MGLVIEEEALRLLSILLEPDVESSSWPVEKSSSPESWLRKKFNSSSWKEMEAKEFSWCQGRWRAMLQYLVVLVIALKMVRLSCVRVVQHSREVEVAP